MAEAKTVWVTGAQGFVGSEISKRLEAKGYQVIGTDVDVSVCESNRLEAFAQEIHPDVIINCAGISRDATSLNGRVKAYEVNALGARNVAVVANSVDALMVQISTDDVYPTRMAEPANEFDTPHPETPYGKSKLAGEDMVRNIAPKHLIVRTSWLYSVNGGQVKEALDAAAEGRTIEARTDQYASPTSISTYVNFIAKAIERNGSGVVHITAQGITSRYTFLSKMLEICGYDPGKVLKPEADLVTAEQVLLESLMLEMVGVELPTWEDDLQSYLEEVGLA